MQTVTNPLFLKRRDRMNTKARLSIATIGISTLLTIVACSSQSASAPKASASGIGTLEAASLEAKDMPLTKEMISSARDIVFRAELAEARKLTPEERLHNDAIRGALQRERLEVLTKGLPNWVANRLATFEGMSSDYGYAYSRSVAWGTGTYKGKTFYWFGHTNSDAWLQMDLSLSIDQKDIDQIYGIKPDDLERVPTNKSEVEVSRVDEAEVYSVTGTRTHIGLADNVDWTEAFCAKLDRTTCDTGGALEKYLLSAANEVLPSLKFKLGGRFPR